MVADLTLSIRFPLHISCADEVSRSTVWQEAITRVEGFQELRDDWDGNGAEPPSAEIVSAAIEWLNRMPQLDERAVPPTQIVPGSLGEVLFIWQSESQFIEAEIENPDDVEWMIKVGDAEPEFCSTPVGRAVVLTTSELSAVNG